MGCLRELGIEQLAYRPIGSFRGQQQIFFARALAQQPDLLVLTSPSQGWIHQPRRLRWSCWPTFGAEESL